MPSVNESELPARNLRVQTSCALTLPGTLCGAVAGRHGVAGRRAGRITPRSVGDSAESGVSLVLPVACISRPLRHHAFYLSNATFRCCHSSSAYWRTISLSAGDRNLLPALSAAWTLYRRRRWHGPAGHCAVRRQAPAPAASAVRYLYSLSVLRCSCRHLRALHRSAPPLFYYASLLLLLVLSPSVL